LSITTRAAESALLPVIIWGAKAVVFALFV
jgi:hypothetical protein